MTESDKLANRTLVILQKRKKSFYIRYAKFGDVVLGFVNDIDTITIRFIGTESRIRNK
ncbi:hypothetical protein HF650_08090 [Kosakonia sp. SMBL-WEM22]|uniref:hypothetical protein n=1 Tax=Kosakonia sp. SMBL-WEM22 TaxID=2725560 RepID=UPI0016591FFA|nr:hypothetical protein [Kosakonia sp. SMBL-WEM22]MDV5355865.1 hypothetical protein [Enterobacter asburiae]QNQ19719.1 hypothetical protein HF650_08090 [Kosakonia sp. SMBL-WEM22]